MGRGIGRLAASLLAGLAAGAVAASAPAAGELARPARIVSLNMCTDELLLRLADPDRINSVTWLSQDPGSANMAGEARRHPANHGLAEEVLAARPDLVVAGRYTTRITVALLKRAGIRVAEFDAPESLSAAEDQIREFAGLVGEPARGEALVADMERRLRALPAPPFGPRPRGLVLRPNGFTAGRGSLVDDVLTRAGIDNLAARLDLGTYHQVPLETVILEGVDLLVVDAAPRGAPALASALLQHPALLALKARLRLLPVPSRLWTCAGPGLVEAVERLRAALPRSGPGGGS